jgi:hypothetical protein
MILWIEWWIVVRELRPACARTRNFLWLMTALAGISVRQDILGVSSIIRSLGLCPMYYDRLLDFFHSSAIDPNRLAQVWTALVLRFFPVIPRVAGRIILLADGIKVPKSGRKMPAVKLLHQESDNNTKPDYIMGHSCQAVSLVVGAERSAFAVPLATRIHEGLVFSNRFKRKLTDKMVSLVKMIGIVLPFYFVADAYYACQTVASGLLADGAHIVTRVRNNAVAYRKVSVTGKRRPGRPTLYGKKLKLAALFKNTTDMIETKSPVYGETDVLIRYHCVNLIWKPLKRVVRFVAVAHPVRGTCLLMCTDLTLDPVDIIRLYGIRFKIEVSFKSSLRVIGAYAYHFWMRSMNSIKRNAGNQYLHCETETYRRAIRRKIDAYHRYIQVALIAQGLIQYLSASFPTSVWNYFGSWLRTIRPGIPPSEMVTAQALRSTLPEFLTSSSKYHAFTKFILDKIDLNRSEGLRMTG